MENKKTNILDYAGAITGIAGQIGSWLGIGEKKQDKRQISQQEKLNAVNAKTSKELADYEQELKMKMWNDTNYGAQMAQADKAGVSRAAVLGGGGSGVGQGASVNSISGGGAADAASAMNAATNKAMSAAQLGLTTAQTANLNADTKKKEVDAAKAAGAETDNTIANTKYTNTITELNNLEKALKGINVKIAGKLENEMFYGALGELKSKVAKGNIDAETTEAEIKRITAEASGAIIENQAKKQGIKLDQAKINEINTNLQQEWEKIKLQGKSLDVSKENMKELTEAMLWGAGINATGNVVNSLINLKTGGYEGNTMTQTKRYNKKGKEIGSSTTQSRNTNKRK